MPDQSKNPLLTLVAAPVSEYCNTTIGKCYRRLEWQSYSPIKR